MKNFVESSRIKKKNKIEKIKRKNKKIKANVINNINIEYKKYQA